MKTAVLKFLPMPEGSRSRRSQQLKQTPKAACSLTNDLFYSFDSKKKKILKLLLIGWQQGRAR